jgi:hypothetical protein
LAKLLTQSVGSGARHLTAIAKWVTSSADTRFNSVEIMFCDSGGEPPSDFHDRPKEWFQMWNDQLR